MSRVTHEAVVRTLRRPSARLALAGATVIGVVYSLLAGNEGQLFLFGLFTFIVLTDGLSTYAWGRLEAYYERKAETADETREPDRELVPHRPSQTTKIVAIIGTGLFVLYLLFAIALKYLFQGL